jgi:hypothetical protein
VLRVQVSPESNECKALFCIYVRFFAFGAVYGHEWSFYGHVFGRDDQPKT